jgi:hypothetical protein
MPKNIFAYTEIEYKSYPGYVSLNTNFDGKIVLSVRSRDNTNVSEIELSSDILKDLAYSIANSGLVEM